MTYPTLPADWRKSAQVRAQATSWGNPEMSVIWIISEMGEHFLIKQDMRGNVVHYDSFGDNPEKALEIYLILAFQVSL